MYSYIDRMRAVQLYIKFGMRTGATICQLGCPTKNALKHWYREYERHHDLPAGYVRTKPWYSDEQKQRDIAPYPEPRPVSGAGTRSDQGSQFGSHDWRDFLKDRRSKPGRADAATAATMLWPKASSCSPNADGFAAAISPGAG